MDGADFPPKHPVQDDAHGFGDHKEQHPGRWNMVEQTTPPCLGLFGGPNRKPLGFVIDVLGSIVGSQMLGLIILN